MPLDRRHDSQPSPLAATRLLPLLVLLSCAAPAQGQTSANLTLVSEYVARGVALTTRPAPQLRVDYDGNKGWYAGGFASTVTLDGRGQGQLIAYGGRAQRLSSTLSWDAGISRTMFLRDGGYGYHEFYAGLVLGRASARLFYSPAYYGAARSAYLDLNQAWPLGERLRLAAHAGLLHPFGEVYGGARERLDTRLALATDLGDVSLQLAWQAQWHAYLRGAARARARALSASASLHF
jgi:uncharacterized protein (TIGR02001 family)